MSECFVSGVSAKIVLHKYSFFPFLSFGLHAGWLPRDHDQRRAQHSWIECGTAFTTVLHHS